MRKIGLTGGIGSGKSVVCKIFSTLGVSVFHSDEVSRYLIDHDQLVIDEVKRIFGHDIYRNGKVDRKKLSQQVFTNREMLKKLNSILHPVVAEVFNGWIEKCKSSSYIIKEAAILFESGTDKELDGVITVSAPESIRISRVMERDGTTEEEVLQRIRNQMNEEERLSRSDKVIVNDGHRLVIPQVLEVHNKLKG